MRNTADLPTRVESAITSVIIISILLRSFTRTPYGTLDLWCCARNLSSKPPQVPGQRYVLTANANNSPKKKTRILKYKKLTNSFFYFITCHCDSLVVYLNRTIRLWSNIGYAICFAKALTKRINHFCCFATASIKINLCPCLPITSIIVGLPTIWIRITRILYFCLDEHMVLNICSGLRYILFSCLIMYV